MEKRKKLEQVILIVLIPVFVLSLLYMRLKKGRTPEKGYETAGLKAKYAVGETVAADEAIDTIPEPAGVLDAKYEGSSKDPLKDLLQVYLYKLRLERKERPEKPTMQRIIPIPELDIGGLIWSTDMPQAIINGKVIKIGDTIEGVKVVKIEKKGITVIHQGETVFVPRK